MGFYEHVSRKNGINIYAEILGMFICFVMIIQTSLPPVIIRNDPLVQYLNAHC